MPFWTAGPGLTKLNGKVPRTVLPIATIPDVIVHSKDLAVSPAAPHAKGFSFIDVSWR
jgi:hypothetical protein